MWGKYLREEFHECDWTTGRYNEISVFQCNGYGDKGKVTGISLRDRVWPSTSFLPGGSLPPEMVVLTQLELIRIANSKYHGRLDELIPAVTWNSLAEMSSLRILELHDNELAGTLPPELGQLSYLQEFRIDNNGITGTVPDEYEGMTSLEVFCLSGNDLFGSIPPGNMR